MIFKITSGKKYFFNSFSLNIPSNYDPNTFKSVEKKFTKLKGEVYSLSKVNALLKDIDSFDALAVQNIAVSKTSQYPQMGDRLMKAVLAQDSQKRFLSNGFLWRGDQKRLKHN